MYKRVLASFSTLLMASSAHGFQFGPAETLPVDSYVDAVAIADVNGDGRNDLVAATSNRYGGTDNGLVLAYLGQPDGTLAPATRSPHLGSYGMISLASGDLDLDGNTDMIVGHATGVTVMMATGDGSFAAIPVSLPLSGDSVSVLDVDLDGLPDIVALDWAEGAVIAFGDSSQSFTRRQALQTNAAGYNDMAVDDLNGDGVPDLAVMSGQGYLVPNLSVHLNDGFGSLLAPDTYFVGSSETTRAVATGDFNADGLTDVLLTRGRNTPTHVWIYYQDEFGGLGPAPTTIDSYEIPSDVASADLDGNGLADFVVVHEGWSRVGVYLQQVGGIDAEQLYPVPYGTGEAPGTLALGDVDGDGCTDAALAIWSGGIALLRGDGCEPPPPPPSADLDVSLGRAGGAVRVGVAHVSGNAIATSVAARVELSPSKASVRLLSWPEICAPAASSATWAFDCVLPDLAEGQAVELRFEVKARKASVLSSAEVSSATPDPRPDNNGAMAQIQF